MLEEYVGEEIEIHYLMLGESITEKAILKFPLSKDSFYIGSETRQHIIYFDRNENGKRSGVKLIKNKNGEEIYRNNEIPFDYNNLKKSEKS